MSLSEINKRLHRQEVREQARNVERQALDTHNGEEMSERKRRWQEKSTEQYAPYQEFVVNMPQPYFARYAHAAYVGILEGSEWLRGEWELPESVWGSQLRQFLACVMFVHSMPVEERREGDGMWPHVCDYAQRLYVSNNWWSLIQRYGELCYTDYAGTRDDTMGAVARLGAATEARDQLDPRLVYLMERCLRLPKGWVEVYNLPSEYRPRVCRKSSTTPSG